MEEERGEGGSGKKGAQSFISLTLTGKERERGRARDGQPGNFCPISICLHPMLASLLLPPLFLRPENNLAQGSMPKARTWMRNKKERVVECIIFWRKKLLFDGNEGSRVLDVCFTCCIRSLCSTIIPRAGFWSCVGIIIFVLHIQRLNVRHENKQSLSLSACVRLLPRNLKLIWIK